MLSCVCDADLPVEVKFMKISQVKIHLKSKHSCILKVLTLHNFIYFTSVSKEMGKILEVAEKLGMTGKEFIWIVYLTSDSTNPVPSSFHDGMFGESLSISEGCLIIGPCNSMHFACEID
jgi:hypothetical protein